MLNLSEVPSLKEEIDRKSFETINWLIHSYEKGSITLPQFSTGVDALFMATSGLTDEGVLRMITEALSMATANKMAPLKRHFVKENMIRSFTWEVGDEKVMNVKRINGMAEGGDVRTFSTPAGARTFFSRLGEVMEPAGWAEI